MSVDPRRHRGPLRRTEGPCDALTAIVGHRAIQLRQKATMKNSARRSCPVERLMSMVDSLAAGPTGGRNLETATFGRASAVGPIARTAAKLVAKE